MSEQIILKSLVDAKIARAIAANQPCPFPPGSHAAHMFHQRAQQPNHAPAIGSRVDLAQGA